MKILVVDGQPGAAEALAQGLRELLGADGQALAAEGSARALECASAEGAPDALVTEAVLDGANGFELRRAIEALRPGLRTVYLTAYDLRGYEAEISGASVLHKPAGASEVLAELRNPAPVAGRAIGPYVLRRQIGEGAHSQIFEAMQTSMDRVVALKVLRPEQQGDPAAVRAFVAQASARANVQHPSILAVYEAGEDNGVSYYTREYVDGSNLAGLAARGETIDDTAALQCLKVAAEAAGYLQSQKIPHPPLTAGDVYLGRDGRPRLNNTAGEPGTGVAAPGAGMQALGRAVADVLPGRAAASAGLQSLLDRMQIAGSGGVQSWNALLQEVRALEPKVVPRDAFKLSQQDAAALAAVRAGQRRQQRLLVWTTVGLFAAFWIVAAAGYYKFFRGPSAREFNRMIPIPAGDFVYQNGETVNLPDFWIDEYEVTVAQYGAFLDALAAHPTAEYDSPDQPPGRLHGMNPSWLKYRAAAATGGTYNGAPVDLNCPAAFIDWFDAYAYAKWKGHRLPTEQEWEKAGRGTDGRRFPWGEDPGKTARVNTSADYDPASGSAKGNADGYNRWSPVDAMTGDRSPYGVMDMAGNVSEWTATVLAHGGLNYPVVRGGNFGSADVEITRRVTSVSAYDAKDRIGFRTVSDVAPPGK
jgi:formylglycine-generating enzyme required for sulfatase activity/CheY-like chemotaxis protein